jgi:diguanylate cyclase
VNKAAETEDWRRKYFDSLREMEQEERQFRAQLAGLRRLVNRLCAAAQGQSPRLDQELQRLKDAVRREVGENELEPLGQAIADAVHELDHGTATLVGLKTGPEGVAGAGNAKEAPADAVLGDERVRAVLSRLLTELRREPRLVEGAAAVDRDLLVSLTREQLPQIVERVGGLVVQRIQILEKARSELEILLGQLMGQLDHLSQFIAGQAQDDTERSASHAALDSQIAGEMQAMGESMETGTDLVSIRQQLRARLDSISRHLHSFREREETRQQQVRERTEQMRGRMEELESEASKLKARLLVEKRQSLIDALTQIPNRLAYEQRVAEEMERWRRFAQPTCVAAWDVDRFKAVNDSWGHRAGDKVLSVVAECLAKSIRATDFVARYGGEEFVMVLPGTSIEDATKLANNIREAVAQLGFHFRGEPVSVTISCGITSLRTGDKAEDAFDRADKAVYQAKDAGRNRVVSA